MARANKKGKEDLSSSSPHHLSNQNLTFLPLPTEKATLLLKKSLLPYGFPKANLIPISHFAGSPLAILFLIFSVDDFLSKSPPYSLHNTNSTCTTMLYWGTIGASHSTLPCFYQSRLLPTKPNGVSALRPLLPKEKSPDCWLYLKKLYCHHKASLELPYLLSTLITSLTIEVRTFLE